MLYTRTSRDTGREVGNLFPKISFRTKVCTSSQPSGWSLSTTRMAPRKMVFKGDAEQNEERGSTWITLAHSPSGKYYLNNRRVLLGRVIVHM